MGWLLYPRELFLGFIYEGTETLEKSAAYYQKYLENKPLDRFATLRLSGVYERMGQPEKALPFLKALVQHRARDWDAADKYLLLLKNAGEMDAFYDERLSTIRRMRDSKPIPRARLIPLLEEAWQDAQWRQKTEDEEEILLTLISHSNRSQDYLQALHWHYLSHKVTEKVLERLTATLKEDPKNLSARMELGAIYLVNQRLDEALEVAREGLKFNPREENLLHLLLAIQEKRKDGPGQIEAVKILVQLPDLDEDERDPYFQRLVYLYTIEKDEGAALGLARQRWEKTSTSKWLDILLNTAMAFKNNAVLEEILLSHLKDHPEDITRMKFLADLYLYEQKRLDLLPFYRDYVQKSRQVPFALDIAYLLSDDKRYADAVHWVKSVIPYVGSDARLIDIAVASLFELKDYEAALAFLDDFMRGGTAPASLYLKAAQASSALFDPRRAQGYLEKYLEASLFSFSSLIEAGKEFFFMGETNRAEEFFLRASALESSNPIPLFWLSEVHQAQGNKRKAKHYASHTLNAADGKGGLKREMLKMEARSGLSPSVLADYESHLQPKESHKFWWVDYLDILLEKNALVRASDVLARYEKAYPQDEKGALSYALRLSQLKEDFRSAAAQAQKLHEKDPSQPEWSLALAEASFRTGRYFKAHEILENLKLQGRTGTRRDELLALVREKREHHLESYFHLVDFGEDQILEWGEGFNTRFGDRTTLSAEIRQMRVRSSIQSYTGDATRFEARVGHEITPEIAVSGGMKGVISSPLKTAGGFVETKLKPFKGLNLTLSYDHHVPRVDLAQTVATGALENRGFFGLSYFAFPRIVLELREEIRFICLPDGADAYENRLEPAVFYTVLDKPFFFQAGYQFSWNRSRGDDSFYDEVPLLKDASIHYLTGTLSHKVRKNLTVEGGFFLGEDTERKLHLFKGELWGVRSLVSWKPLSWLDLDTSYSYGKETLSTVSGHNHNLEVSLSGHWR